jgi:uncharacterized surface protein with fasciclin (FAS1) repeats
MARIIEAAKATDKFHTLIKALETVGLSEILDEKGPYTLIAPTDRAFASVDPAVMKRVLANSHQLRQLLSYHVLSGKYSTTDFAGQTIATTLLGEDLIIHHDDGRIKLDGAWIVETDIAADNGVIHGTDALLVPSVLSGALEGKATVG